MNEILTRVSYRKFLQTPVESKKLQLILKAAMQAPSAGNQQPWEFIVVTDQAMLEKLEQVSPYAKSLLSAPVAIVMLYNESVCRHVKYVEQDMGACAQNIQLMCEHLGLGAVWLGICPDSERMKFISDCFELPNHVFPFAILPLGYPEEKRESKLRYDESKVSFNCYK